MPTPPGLEVTDRIRSAVITAVFSVDDIFDRLALKGGNALRLIYAIQDRTSLDLDFSLEGDLSDFEQTRQALFHSLRDRLDSAGYHVFDERFEQRPRNPTEAWGGYRLEFKVVSKEEYLQLAGDVEQLRRRAVELSSTHHRTWRVEISKFEFCTGKRRYELDDYTIFVYTPEMIVIEKLRALCQQMPEYPYRGHPSPRSRDFYDIYETLQSLIGVEDLKTSACADLAHSIFDAKKVPLMLLHKIRQTRDFHAPDWPSVEQAVVGRPEAFDFYFDFVAQLAEELESLWIE